MKLFYSWAVLLLSLHSGIVHAQAMRMCVDEKSQAPFIDASGAGILGQLIQEASREAGIAVSFHSAPVARCRERLRLGEADAFPTTPFTPALTSYIAYPMAGSVADARRAAVVAKSYVYRRVGSKAEWDGHKFSNLHSSVLIPTGAALLSDRLDGMGVRFDDSGKTLEQNFLKLSAGRAELAIGAEHSGRELLATSRFSTTLERLPMQFTEEPYYVGVSSAYYRRHKQAVDAMWRAISKIRASAKYRSDYAKAMLAPETDEHSR